MICLKCGAELDRTLIPEDATKNRGKSPQIVDFQNIGVQSAYAICTVASQVQAIWKCSSIQRVIHYIPAWMVWNQF